MPLTPALLWVLYLNVCNNRGAAQTGKWHNSDLNPGSLVQESERKSDICCLSAYSQRDLEWTGNTQEPEKELPKHPLGLFTCNAYLSKYVVKTELFQWLYTGSMISCGFRLLLLKCNLKYIHKVIFFRQRLTHFFFSLIRYLFIYIIRKVKVKLLSSVWFFVTPWHVAYHISLSMGFSRQEYWSRLPFPSPEDLPNPGIEPGFPAL